MPRKKSANIAKAATLQKYWRERRRGLQLEKPTKDPVEEKRESDPRVQGRQGAMEDVS